MQEIIARYPEGTPELSVEEYLAHLAETNPQSPVWRQFVYEVKQLLRRAFGDRVEYTEEDVRAFLSKAQKRAERAKAADAAEFAKVQEELRFAKGKPKGPLRRSWEEVRKGDLWNSVKKWLPKENIEPSLFPTHGTQEQVVERAYQFITSNPIVTDWTGRLVYLPYPQPRGRYANDPVRNKAEHLVGHDIKQGTHQRVLDPEKAKWLMEVPNTIANGRVRVRHQGEVLYFRNYRGRTHMVVTGTEGVFLKQAVYESGLVSQYPVYLKDEDFKEAFVEQINPAPLQ